MITNANTVAQRFPVCVLFGGSGFIGTHLAAFLARHRCEQVYLADIRPPTSDTFKEFHNVQYMHVDVRKPIDTLCLPKHADLVVNLAATHREPGHEPHEYFETN